MERKQNVQGVEIVILPEFDNQPAFLSRWDEHRHCVAVFPPDMNDAFRDAHGIIEKHGPYVKVYSGGLPIMIRTHINGRIVADFTVTYYMGKAQINSLIHHVIFRDFACTFDRGQRIQHPSMTDVNHIEYMRTVDDGCRVRLLIGGEGWGFKASFEKPGPYGNIKSIMDMINQKKDEDHG